MPSERHPRRRGARKGETRAEEALQAAGERAATALVLFTAVARLHDARGREDVFCAIGEIAAGCLRSPDVAVYLPDPEGDGLRPVYWVGPRETAPRGARALAEGLVERAAAERRVAVGPETHPGARDVAVPLGSAPGAGVMLVFSLPVDGPELSAELRQRLEIVGRHVGIALAGPRG